MTWRMVCWAGVAAAGVGAHQIWAQPADGIVLPEVEVVGTAPIAAGSERDKVPASTEVLRREDVTRTGPASALRSLDERVGGIALDQAQSNPFQPNLQFRGYEASPLAGNPQGLAVYLNGTRFNAPFGDTTNWDLIPDAAIERIELSGSNPAFGLNALGGAVSVRLRDGFSDQGGQVELSGGSFGRIQLSGQYGVQQGNAAAYLALSGLNEDGWRYHSPSQLRQIYGDIGVRGEKTEVHVSIVGALNTLTGNGPTPVQLLSVDRSAIFTAPDTTKNRYLRAMLSGTSTLNESWSVQANAYVSALSQRTYNGDAADVQACADDPGTICSGDGNQLTQRDGTPIPNVVNPGYYAGLRRYQSGGPYAILNETATDSTGYGAAVQATYRSEIAGRANRLLFGASFDGGDTMFSARSSLGALSLDRTYVGPGIVIDQADGSIVPVRLSAQNRYYGFYAQDALDLTARLSLTLAGRLNVANIRLRDQIGSDLNGDHTYVHFNPAAGFTYKILPSLTAYAGVSVANRTPTPAELSCAASTSPCSLTNFFVSDPSLKQVVARTWEAGLRGRFEWGEAEVSWNAGLFRSDADDDILYTNSDVTGRGYFRNVGQTRRQGAEAGLNLRRGPVSAYLSYAYTDATFQTPFSALSSNNPLADADGTIQVAKGNRIPGVPQNQLKFGVHYAVTPKWTLGTTGTFSSGRVLRGDEANLTPHTGSYVVFNLNTSYKLTEKVEVFGLVQNMFNARYATYGTFSPVNLVPIVQVASVTDTRSLSVGAPVAGYGGVRVSF